MYTHRVVRVATMRTTRFFVDRYGKRFRCLIPLNAVAIAAALVVFQRIGERGGIATE